MAIDRGPLIGGRVKQRVDDDQEQAMEERGQE